MKTRTYFVLIFLLIFIKSAMISAQSNPEELIDLSDFRWENRLLLVFTPELSHSKTIEVMSMIENNREGILDRDLLVFYIFEKGQSTYGDSLMNEKSEKHLRQKYYATNGETTVVVIGKDGGEKYRQINQIDVDRIFARIDMMPMRKSELEERNFNFDSIDYDEE